MTAIRLQLRLAWSPGSDSAAKARERNSLADQAWKPVFLLCQLDLQTSFPGAGAGSENIKNQRRSVDHPRADYIFQISDLRCGKLVVKKNQSGVQRLSFQRNFFRKTVSDIGPGIRRFSFLCKRSYDFRSGRFCQLTKFRKRISRHQTIF